MSYNGFSDDRGRGQRGSGRTAPETTAVRMRKMIFKHADDEDFDSIEDPPRLAKVLRRGWREGAPGIMDGFRYGVTEMPFKQAHYVTLLLHLSYRVEGEEEEQEETDCGREILEELARSFRASVEAREWLNARLLLQFLSLLVPAGLVEPRSLVDAYKSLLSVLNEVGGGGDRAERAARAVGEGIIRSAHALAGSFAEDLESIVRTIEMFVTGRKGTRSLVNPLAPILAEGEEPEAYADPLSHLMTALLELRASEWQAPAILPRPSENAVIPEGATMPDPYAISPVYMPPEMYDVDEENPQDCEGRTSGLVLFNESVVPPTNTILGWTLRSLLLDTLNIFEVNRKECARFLLNISRYLAPGTFKSEESESTYSLESSVVSTIISTLCTLPNAPHSPLMYGSVITELCKLSPATIAPPVGRAVRRIFTQLGEDGLDIEISRRVSDWFAIHLSNFGFQWMWKEWIPDLELPAAHPRRAFMRRVVEQEIRLAYHDRILQTLPEPMLAKDAEVVSPEAPDPVWQYEAAGSDLHAEASDLLRRMKNKAPSHEVKNFITDLPDAMDQGGDSLLRASIVKMVTETILKLGDRSFSHFLNATERYLDVLRFITNDYASRRVVLDAIVSFWRRSSQMRLITIDKYLQYSILEPLDVVDWVFAAEAGSDTVPDGWTDVDKWEVLRMALDKIVGRVVRERRRLRAVDKADEVARARRAAERLERGEGVGMDDGDDDPDRSREAQEVQSQVDVQTDRLERVFSATVQRFAEELLPWAYGREGAGLKSVLALLDAGDSGAWPMRARWGWWREFVRSYAQLIEPLADSIETEVFAIIPPHSAGLEARSEAMVRGVWADALGRE
ncbi:uncharacterized protein CcaverHIS019_0508710 [Cutaneotrichosporon cavernicola]|uniref:Cap binding protein 80-PB n=1 Tax=Cutaneotrichosporon cavernicola TaxID=279322 RepID=A0AA48QXD2_9TREE|nr:uncharacterized protein CcaverHIS019_0508710 [Cutaneotrichosporon cavernicola]BEI93243.1 hypothetical protein CcaverHIS019_0508710 [Cutaneotrichosporon cavernicola]BEJ08787.1 hypothetical protein CcaverHIS641_0508810 [Cutaneotrichosporon cavernicola]